ncbi:MAG: tyrosine-type recombinase/integrase [Anaerolineales bacterium]|jgi:integrase/recombinase XerD
MLISKCIEGYFFDKTTTYSKKTLDAYHFVFNNLINFLGDKEITEVTPDDLKRYINWLREDYKPVRPSGDTSPLAPASVDLNWKGVRSLFHWANDELGVPRPDLKMPRPSFKRPHVQAFSEDEIRRLLKACEYTVDKAHNGSSHVYRQRRPTAHRDKAFILTLLDTGLRLGEALRLTIGDVNYETGEIIVAPFGTGKKTRPRVVLLGATSRRAVWLYVARLQNSDPSDRLFPMSPVSTRMLLDRLGERAKVPNVHPHRFRHSFALWYLRNGGDIFTLQRLLGHGSLDMVNYYLDIERSDIATAHKRASAIDRWNKISPV